MRKTHTHTYIYTHTPPKKSNKFFSSFYMLYWEKLFGTPGVP